MTLYNELGRAVSRGFLPHQQAEAALLVGIARDRQGGVADRFRIARHILRQNINNHDAARDAVSGRIMRLLKPLIGIRAPWGVLMAEAHEANGAAGFPLDEDEVSQLVEVEVWWSLPPAPRQHKGVRHGG